MDAGYGLVERKLMTWPSSGGWTIVEALADQSVINIEEMVEVIGESHSY